MDVRADMLVFQDFTALTEVLGRDIRAKDPGMSVGCPSQKLTLWADFLFLKKGQSGAKILLGLRGKSQEKVSRTGAKKGCTGAKKVRTNARDFFLTLAAEAQRTFAPLPGNFAPFGRSTPFPRPPGSQNYS